jgi:hypothetical protein
LRRLRKRSSACNWHVQCFPGFLGNRSAGSAVRQRAPRPSPQHRRREFSAKSPAREWPQDKETVGCGQEGREVKRGRSRRRNSTPGAQPASGGRKPSWMRGGEKPARVLPAWFLGTKKPTWTSGPSANDETGSTYTEGNLVGFILSLVNQRLQITYKLNGLSG